MRPQEVVTHRPRVTVLGTKKHIYAEMMVRWVKGLCHKLQDLSYGPRSHGKLDSAVCVCTASTPGSWRRENPKMLLGLLPEQRLQRSARNPVQMRGKTKANTGDSACP